MSGTAMAAPTTGEGAQVSTAALDKAGAAAARALESIPAMYPSGALMQLINHYVDEAGRPVLHGDAVVFYENGQTAIHQRFEENRIEGAYNAYFESGKQLVKVQYASGRPDGEFVLYYETGKVRIKGEFKDGKREGIWRFYRPDGTLARAESANGESGLPATATALVNLP